MTLKVLVVDDSRMERELIRHILSSHADVECGAEAENGLQALEQYRIHRPDVVIMDIVMPEMDGIESLKRIIALDPGANVVIASSSGQEGLIMEGIVAGAKRFLLKPFQPGKVLDSIRGAVRPG